MGMLDEKGTDDEAQCDNSVYFKHFGLFSLFL